MSQISALEVAVLAKEISKHLPCKIINIYQFNNLFNIKLRCGKEKKNLLIEPSERVHFTNVIYEWKATNVATLLRKHIRNKYVENVNQIDFDRILKFDISGGYTLIVEILSRGNLILLKEGKIIFSTNYIDMKDRSIKPGLPYVPPPSPSINPLTSSDVEIINYIKSFDMPIKGLIRLGIGKKYAIFLLNSLGLDEKVKSLNVSDKKWTKLLDSLKSLIKVAMELEIKPCVYFENEEAVDFSIIPLSQYNTLECKKFTSLNEALDYFYSLNRLAGETPSELEREIEKIRKRILKQHQLIEEYTKKATKYRFIAEKLYENLADLESLISIIRQARKERNLSWEEIADKIKEGKEKGIKETMFVKKINTKNGRIIINLNNHELEVDINTQISKLAEKYYEKAKKMESKISRAREELEKSERDLSRLLEGQREEEKKRKIVIRQAKTKWYHRFHWFIASTGHLVVAGRDAETNETLVKDYMEKEDIFLHAEIYGGAVTLIKFGRRNLSKEALLEAAKFAACYSSAWKKGLAAIDVFWCYPESVSLRPPSGLYLPKGSFIIKEKNYIKNVPLELAIGVKIHQIDELNYTYELITGPIEAVKKQTSLYVILIPGNMSKSDAAKKIKSELFKLVKDENPAFKKIIESLDINKIVELLPGPSYVKGVDKIGD